MEGHTYFNIIEMLKKGKSVCSRDCSRLLATGNSVQLYLIPNARILFSLPSEKIHNGKL